MLELDDLAHMMKSFGVMPAQLSHEQARQRGVGGRAGGRKVERAGGRAGGSEDTYKRVDRSLRSIPHYWPIFGHRPASFRYRPTHIRQVRTIFRQQKTATPHAPQNTLSKKEFPETLLRLAIAAAGQR